MESKHTHIIQIKPSRLLRKVKELLLVVQNLYIFGNTVRCKHLYHNDSSKKEIRFYVIIQIQLHEDYQMSKSC
jgi:hypothetical protein